MEGASLELHNRIYQFIKSNSQSNQTPLIQPLGQKQPDQNRPKIDEHWANKYQSWQIVASVTSDMHHMKGNFIHQNVGICTAVYTKLFIQN